MLSRSTPPHLTGFQSFDRLQSRCRRRKMWRVLTICLQGGQVPPVTVKISRPLPIPWRSWWSLYDAQFHLFWPFIEEPTLFTLTKKKMPRNRAISSLSTPVDVKTRRASLRMCLRLIRMMVFWSTSRSIGNVQLFSHYCQFWKSYLHCVYPIYPCSSRDWIKPKKLDFNSKSSSF